MQDEHFCEQKLKTRELNEKLNKPSEHVSISFSNTRTSVDNVSAASLCYLIRDACQTF